MSSASTKFPDPASYAKIPVYDLLRAASLGYAALDLRLIRSIVDRGEEAVPDLVRFGMEDHEEDRVDLEEDLIAIFRQLRTPAALPYLIGCIRRQPSDIPDDIIEAILPFREQAVDPLLALYSELDEEDGSDLAFLLAGLRMRDERILKLLLERLEFDAADGAFSLGLYGDPAAIPELERVVAGIPESESELRREIESAITEIREPPADWDPVSHKFDLTEFYAEKASPPYEVLEAAELVEMLKSESAEHRAAAAEGLRNEDLDEPMRRRLFDLARTDPDSTVRGRCWETLADSDDPKMRDAMKSVAADPSRTDAERGGAIVGLCNAVEDPGVVERLREFYDTPNLRAKALEAMWRSFDRQFAQYFPKHLGDADPEIKRQAVWGTGYMGIGAEAGKLRKMFDDEDYRHDALFAYALCVPGDFSRGRVRGILRKIDTLAGGLSQAETDLVQTALDQRLAMHGMEPVFASMPDESEEERPGPQLVKNAPEAKTPPDRNDPCPCGSGKKYKKCHGA